MGLRDQKKKESRDRMLEAAEALFRERGIDAVSVREIADRARVSLKTVYNYFSSKDALLDEIALQVVVATTQRLEAALRSSRTAREEIEDIGAAWGRRIARAPEYAAEVFQRSSIFRARGDARELELRMYEALAALLRRDQSRSVIRSDIDPLALAELLIAGWMLASLNWLARWWKSRGNLPERLRAATRTVFQGAEP